MLMKNKLLIEVTNSPTGITFIIFLIALKYPLKFNVGMNIAVEFSKR